jgi:hypothetical protein
VWLTLGTTDSITGGGFIGWIITEGGTTEGITDSTTGWTTGVITGGATTFCERSIYATLISSTV